MERSTTLRELWDTTRMRLLVEIERRGSVSGAAAEIGIGQPSASQHLRLLEAAAGERLVERDGRGSRLTEAGRVLAARASQALTTLAAADEELAALSGLQAGTIHLGASTAPGVYLLPDTLGCFRREFPNVTVEVEIASSGEVLDRLLRGAVQLAIVGAQRADPRVALEPFLEEELAAAGAVPAGVWELGSSEAIKRAAREGLGVSFLSRHAVAEEVERGDLEVFRLAGRPPLRRSFSIARLAGRPPSPAESAFVATLTRCCAKSAEYAASCV